MKKIGIKWIIHTVPWRYQFLFLIFSTIMSFEGVLNAILFGQLTDVNVKDVNYIYSFMAKALLAYLIVYTCMLLFYLTQNKIVMFLNQALKKEYFLSNFYHADKNKTDTADAVNSITNISKEIEQKYFYGLTDLWQMLFSVIASAIVVVKTNIVLGIIYLVLSTLTFIPSYLGKRTMTKKTNKWTVANSQLIQIIKDIFAGHDEIINFGVRRLFFRRFDHSLYREENNYRKMNDSQFKVQYIAWLISLATLLLPIFIGLIFIQKHLFGVTIGAIITLSLSADRVVSGLRMVAMYQSQIQSTSSIRVIDNYRFNDNKINNQRNTGSSILELSNVSVAYGDNTILSNINLVLKNKDKVIITGASGIGKSTLLDCIAGRTPYSGTISFNYRKVNAADFIKVSQKIWLFSGTIRENLNLLEEIPDQKLLQVLEKVGLLKELGSNPLDFKIQDGGANLSGGQAQRIAVARGLLRHKRVYLFDEITSNLDRDNAVAIRELIYQLPAIVIEVAHTYDLNQAQRHNVKIWYLTDDKIMPK